MNIDDITKSVNVGGLTFPVVDHGQGPAVLLLHGFPDSRYLWRFQIPTFVGAGFRVIAPDLRGFGDAPKPNEVEAYKMSIVVQDVIGLLDALEIDKAHLVAHDWGAALAWRVVAYHPDRFKKLVALSVGHPGNSGWWTMKQRELFWYILYFQFEGVAEDWLRHDNWKGLREWTRGAGDLERYFRDLSRPGALTAALNWYRANAKPSPSSNGRGELPPFKLPVMGVWSDGDVFLSQESVKNSHEKLVRRPLAIRSY